MRQYGESIRALFPYTVATLLTLVVYFPQASLLLLKLGEVFGGVFDTSVPAYPLAGMLFTLIFVLLRRRELNRISSDRRWAWGSAMVGFAIAAVPLVALLWTGSSLGASYSFAGLALVCSWVGIAVALRPSLFAFVWPYLALYLAAVGLVGLLTEAFGDPLAIVVASISRTATWALRLPVQWSSVYIDFVAAGGQSVSLVITQECSGIASISIFLLVVGLMHLDVKPRAMDSVALAAGGFVLFLLLNALRVVALVAAGVESGQDLMWNIHGWIGYALYVVGYSTVILLYFRRTRLEWT